MLDGVRVVEWADGLAAAYCGRMLADAGASVTVAEPPGGHPLAARRPTPESPPGLWWAYLAGGKARVARSQAGDLLAGADIIIGDLELTVPERREKQGQVVVSLSPFGRTGPWRHRPATEFTLQALSGSTGKRGLPGRPPVAAGGNTIDWAAGLYAAAIAASCWWGGCGGRLDVSLLECAALTMQAFMSIEDQLRPTPPDARRKTLIPSVEPSADGFVGFSTITSEQFRDFLLMIERPDLADDESLLDVYVRQDRAGELHEAIRAWTTSRSTAEIVELATAWRVPATPIGNGDSLPRLDQTVERGIYRRGPAGLCPRPPFSIGATTAAAAPATTSAHRAPTNATRRYPMAGLRVADFSAFWAGPATTQLLASLGANVTKVESPERPDGMRFVTSRPHDPRFLEWGAVFHAVNTNKADVTLDLRRQEGQDAARRLISGADVVIENFSPRVMEHFGLGWDEVARLNPRAVMVRMPAFGLSGPWRDRTGFAMTVEQASGMAWRTGFADDLPMDVGGVCDPAGGMAAVVAVVAALRQRERTGVGALVEVPLLEVALTATAEQVVERAEAGVLLGREGNRGPDAAPQGVYRCAGDDRWVAVAVADDAQWAGLRRAMGSPAWAEAEALGSASGRRREHDAIDRHVAAWTRTRREQDVVDALVAEGVPAAVIVTPAEIRRSPQLRARGFFEEVVHPVVGRLEIPSLPYEMDGAGRRWLATAAPTLGQHTDEVLAEMLGKGPASPVASGKGGKMTDVAATSDMLADPEPREARYTVISVDDHLVEPPDMFVGRLPARFADDAPRVEARPGGGEQWVYDGQRFPQLGLNAVVGHARREDWTFEPATFDDMRRGCWDIDARIADMDLNGVWASVNFPSMLTGFCGTVFSRTADPALGRAVMTAWNDWLYEAWYGPYPERIVPMGITWLADPEVGAAEVRRNAARGFTAVTLPEQPHRIGYPSLHAGYWDPILAACEETDTTVCLHVASSGPAPATATDAPQPALGATLFQALALQACADWLWSGVAVRFPGLKIAMSEGGIGWVPMLLDRVEFMLDQSGHGRTGWMSAELSPSDVLHRNFWFCTIDDPSTMPIRHRIGVERIMVEVDYPHADSTWPDTQDFLDRQMTGIPVEEVRMMTHGNAARLFRHPLPERCLP